MHLPKGPLKDNHCNFRRCKSPKEQQVDRKLTSSNSTLLWSANPFSGFCMEGGATTVLLYRRVNSEEIEHNTVGKSGIRFSRESHIVPYLERAKRKNPSSQSKPTGKKATLTHLDLLWIELKSKCSLNLASLFSRWLPIFFPIYRNLIKFCSIVVS